VNSWTTEELTRIAETDEMHIAARRRDGTDRKPVIVWMVRVGDDVYTRSVNGPQASWFRGTRIRHEGHIDVDGLVKDVTFVDVDADDPLNDELDAAYRSKYRRYRGPVDSITNALARSTTLKLIPQQDNQEQSS
jgi:hypothetical protein